MKRPKFKRGQIVVIETHPDKNKSVLGGYLCSPIHHYATALNGPITGIKDLLKILEAGHTVGVDENGDYISSDTIGLVVDSFFNPPKEFRFDEVDDEEDFFHDVPGGWYYVILFENKRFGFRERELRSL